MKRSHLVVAVGLGLGLVGLTALTFAAFDERKPKLEQSQAVLLETRTQYQLAAAIAAAKSAAAGREGALYAKARRDYAGRRFQWEAAVVPELCQNPGRCFVAPFDHARADAPKQQGWLIELELDAEAHEKLERACSRHTPGVCVVSFDGQLEKLVLRADLPTRVGFSDVRIATARSARSNESWIRRAR